MDKGDFDLDARAIRWPYNHEVAAFCNPFSCNDADLDDFFANVAPYYDTEMLGKTYAWVNNENPKQILGMVTLANDSVKARLIANSARNRLQRGITNAKRGMNYPAVLIGRLGVAAEYQGNGLNIGSQIIDFIKEWFRSIDNKTGCRFIVVDAYNNKKLCVSTKGTASSLFIRQSGKRGSFWNSMTTSPWKLAFYFLT